MGIIDGIGKLFVKLGIKFEKNNSPSQEITQKNIKGGASAKNLSILRTKKK